MTEDARKVKIDIRNVSKAYEGSRDRVPALEDVSVQVYDGEFLTIVGPSGCGKSTLLRTINGLQRPSDGVVEVGRDDPNAQLSSMVFQSYSVFPWMSIEKNVAMGLVRSSLSKAEKKQRVAHWLERMDIAEFRQSYPSELSGGMLQRVSIARAMAAEPEILLMDEPFAALDAQLRRRLQEELLEVMAHANITVIFVTHSLEEAILLGDRILVMSARPGRIIESCEVPFPRPRDSSLRTSSEFRELEERLWGLLK